MKFIKILLFVFIFFFVAGQYAFAVEPMEPMGICCKNCPSGADYVCGPIVSPGLTCSSSMGSPGMECYFKNTIYKNFPLSKFQEALEECDKTGNISLECWVAGTDIVAENQETAMGGMLPSVMGALVSYIGGTFPVGNEQSYRRGGAIGGITNLIAAMYTNPPASSVEYFADLGKNLGIVKPVYAQAGVGFQGLAPILPLWKAFRNIAYLFFAIVFVVIGFAIMFRIKINPQTVVTIQSAIPKLVVALILVTFSYAIAGLLVDLVYVVIGLGVLVLGPAARWSQGEIINQQKRYMNLSFGKGWALIFGGTNKAIWESLTSSIGSAIFGGAAYGIAGVIAGVVAGALSLPGAAAGAAPVVLLELLLAIISLYVMIKLFISLVKCYVGTILGVIFGPLQITFGVFPGGSFGFGKWFKSLIANIAAFPATALFMLLSWAILKNMSLVNPKEIWSPPVIHTAGGAALALVSFGMLCMVHRVPDMVKKALKEEPFFPYGAAIGEAFGPLRTPARAAALYPIQYGGQQITASYQRYAAAGRPIPPPVAAGNTLANVLRTLGVIK